MNRLDRTAQRQAKSRERRRFPGWTPPLNRPYAHEMRELNPGYQEIVAEASKSVTYLGLWPTRGADDGSLRRNLTPDQVHLNGRDTAYGDAHSADNRRMEPVTLSSAIGQRIGEITCPESTW
ncbi:hypothetical protein [Streptomyces niveus]|uniref:hypothetical protein n=1 Tax=Streptomyces niveus TaxID=193462 RepID=UPI003413ECD9